MKYLIVLFVALIAQSCSNEKIENDWTADNLQGKVLSLSEFSYEAKDRFGNIEKGERKRQSSYEYDQQIKYDEKGNKIERNSYNSDGSLVNKWTYKYDEKGNRTEANTYNSDGSLNLKLIFKYDEKGNITELNGYISDGSLVGKDAYKYDEKGNKIEHKKYDSDGSLYFKYTHKYDEKGNEIEYNGYNSDGSLENKNSYKYEFDKQGNWIKQIKFKDGIPEYILERQYEYYDYITPYENNATASDDVSDGSNVSSSKDYKYDDYEEKEAMLETSKTPVKSSNKKEFKFPKKLNSNSSWTNWKSNFCQTCTDSKGSPSSIKTGVLCKAMIDGGGICTKFDLGKIADDLPTLKNIYGVTQPRLTKQTLLSINGELFLYGESSITNGLYKNFKLKKENGVWFFYDDEKVGGAGWIKLSDYYNTSNQTKEINSNGSTKFPNVEKAKVNCKWCNKKILLKEAFAFRIDSWGKLQEDLTPLNYDQDWYCSRKCGINTED